MNNKHHIDLIEESSEPLTCKQNTITQVVNATLAHERNDGCVYEVHIKTVDPDTIQMLNANYRDKNRVTNVLSFPYKQSTHATPLFLGDIVICPTIIALEAKQQNKSAQQHSIHLLVHALLHLLGYDHETAKEAMQMEQKEIAILAAMQHPNPYKEI